MKFETIKRNAKKIFEGTLAKGSKPSFDAVLPFVLAGQAERKELREFARAYEASPNDLLASRAKAEDGLDSTWSQVVLQAREAGLRLIDNWDVRMVGKLIELFPDCVSGRYHGKPLTCFVADNEAGDWMVEVAYPRKKLSHS